MSSILEGIDDFKQKPFNDNAEKISRLQMAHREAVAATKGFKHGQPVDEVLDAVIAISQKYGLSKEPELVEAIEQIQAAKSQLETAVYGLDIAIKEILDSEQMRYDDENDGLTEAGRTLIKSLDGIDKAFSNPNSPEAKNWADNYAHVKNNPFSAHNWKKNQKKKEKEEQTKHQQTLKDIAQRAVHQIEAIISDTFPDGDPHDRLVNWIRKELRKAGISNMSLEMNASDVFDLAQKAFTKTHGTNIEGYMSDMWDQMQGDDPNNDMWKRKNPFKMNEGGSESPQPIAESPKNLYPVTYAKFHKNKANPTQVDFVELYLANIDFGDEHPTTPERTKYLVDNSAKNQELKSRGYHLEEYGRHIDKNTYYGHPTKINKDGAMNEAIMQGKAFKPINTIRINDKEFNDLLKARMHGKFNFKFFRKSGTNEVTFQIPKGQERKFLQQIDSIIDFGATTAGEVFNITLLPETGINSMGSPGGQSMRKYTAAPAGIKRESSIMKGLQNEGSVGQFPDTEQGAIDAFISMSIYKQKDIAKVIPDPQVPHVWKIVTRDGESHIVYLKGLRGNNQPDFETLSEEFHTGGALGQPMPGTYEQENDPFKSHGARRITAMTSENKK